MGRRAIAAAMLAILAAAGIASAADFEEVARSVESRMGVQRTRIPGMGFFMNSFVAVSRPGGTRAMKAATFESGNGRCRAEVFQSAVREAAGGWMPVVQVQSLKGRDEVALYVKPSGNIWELLIATSERGEATLVYLKIPGRDLAGWFRDKAALREGLSTGVQ